MLLGRGIFKSRYVMEKSHFKILIRYSKDVAIQNAASVQVLTQLLEESTLGKLERKTSLQSDLTGIPAFTREFKVSSQQGGINVTERDEKYVRGNAITLQDKCLKYTACSKAEVF